MTMCTAGLCVAVCGPMTCPTGCCQNNLCHATPDDAACGSAGHMCKVCSGMKHCKANEDGTNFDCK
jgi:hypothetical protein